VEHSQSYDFVFTSLLPLMTDLFTRVGDLPFAPLVGWPIGDGRWIAIGLGDLSMAAAFHLVMRKAFRRAAGLVALLTALVALSLLLAVLQNVDVVTFPGMPVPAR
jgi:hypothetical protein